MDDGIPDPQDALICAMVLMSAADRRMADRELQRIGDQVRSLPVFADVDARDRVSRTEECAARLERTSGLDEFLDRVVGALPPDLAETAYALGCEIAAADMKVPPEERRLLQMLRDRLGLDRLVASAIERTVKARHATV